MQDSNSIKKVLILGAGNGQIDAINYCKERGLKIIACSYTGDDPGIPLLDAFERVDIKDFEKVCELAKKYDVDFIYSIASDLAIPTVMKASELLGLPHFISSKTAEICHSKEALRESLGESFEGNISYVLASKLEEAFQFKSFPGMMKPVDSQGQRGCYRVDSEKDIEKYFEESLSYSIKGKVIIEQFVDGPEISVNGYMKAGEIAFAIVSDRVSFDDLPGGIIKEHHIPSVLPEEVRKSAEDLTNRVAKAVGVENGPVYAQIKLMDGIKPIIIEIAPRLDGCHMWNLIKHYCGIDLLDITFSHLFGSDMDFSNLTEAGDKRYKLEFLCSEPGKIFERDDYNCDDAEYVCWYYETGEKVKKLNGYMEKCGYKICEF